MDKFSVSKSFVQPLEPVESTPDVESISFDFLANLLSTPRVEPFSVGKWGGGDPADSDADDDADDDVQDVEEDALF